MPMPLSLARHLRAPITHEPVAVDGNGKPIMDVHGAHTFAAGKVVMGRIEAAATMFPMATGGGREVVPSQLVYLQDVYVDGTPVSVGHGDRLTLPAGYAPQQAPVLRVRPWDHDLGRYGWEVLL